MASKNAMDGKPEEQARASSQKNKNTQARRKTRTKNHQAE